MVEGIDARYLAKVERMDNLIIPGSILLLTGLLMPVLVEEFNDFTGRFTLSVLNVFNGTFCILLILGVILTAYSLTYRRRGDILMPLAPVFFVLLSIDLFIWIYFAILHWASGPSGIFILPFAALGQIPLLLTLFFVSMVIIARFSYSRDPRKSGKPRY